MYSDWFYCVLQSIQLQLQAPSGNLLAASGEGSVTQSIRVLNPQKVHKSYNILMTGDK